MATKKKMREVILGSALFTGLKLKVEEGKEQEALKEVYSLMNRPTVKEVPILTKVLSIASTVITVMIEERLKDKGFKVEDIKFIIFPDFVKADKRELQKKVDKYEKTSRIAEKLIAFREGLSVFLEDDEKEDK